MEDVLTERYEVVTQRHENPQEGSYTCYLDVYKRQDSAPSRYQTG